MNSSSNELSRPLSATDRLRQAVVLLAAIAQAGVSTLLGQQQGAIARENASSILPAGYAFTIWAVIFALTIATGIAGLLPSLSGHPALRAGGWPLAASMALNALWIVVFAQRQYVLAQVVILLSAAAAIGAALRVQRHAGGQPVVRTLVAGSAGLLAGWLTAATFVGLANTIVSSGGSAYGTSGVGTGVVLLLAATATALAVLWAGSTGPLAGSLAYAASVAWGLAAISVEQWHAAPTTAVTALVLAVATLAFLAWRRVPGARGRNAAPHTVHG
ncbi:hypothetical protein JOF53_001144 [Crossiella equi]|uniref:Tryptophan-rich sensory protein n=1 Tax=Crossiella equi TaxID=130796 RepID=A0ABS5A7M2_9PSEU|nr:hypothetical protein [Crossiella equi]MBP2472272.1 hypothetical protein [Crossiella equi]